MERKREKKKISNCLTLQWSRKVTLIFILIKSIYVYNLTRKEKVAFIGEVGYFGGNLLVMIPKEGIDLEKVVDYINGMEFRKNYLYGGRFKIGHRQLSNAIMV